MLDKFVRKFVCKFVRKIVLDKFLRKFVRNKFVRNNAFNYGAAGVFTDCAAIMASNFSKRSACRV